MRRLVGASAGLRPFHPILRSSQGLQTSPAKHANFSIYPWLIPILCLLSILLAGCDIPGIASSTSTSNKHTTIPTNNGSITYSTNPQDVLIRTFYGGGNSGTLELSPEISIYGNGTYILGPGIQMRAGTLDTPTLQRLIHILVDTDGLLNLHRQQFYDVPDQNTTLLQINLNGKYYEFLAGKFGNLQESTQDIDEYHHLLHALADITQSLPGPTHPYVSNVMALLVHQDFSPDFTQDISDWSLRDFTLDKVATYECGITPPDETGPNADTGCLTLTPPHYAFLPTAQQLDSIKLLLKGQQEGVFYEQAKQLYYQVAIRPLLPDEMPQQLLAMLGSQQLSYVGVPLHSGPIPTPTVTPTP